MPLTQEDIAAITASMNASPDPRFNALETKFGEVTSALRTEITQDFTARLNALQLSVGNSITSLTERVSSLENGGDPGPRYPAHKIPSCFLCRTCRSPSSRLLQRPPQLCRRSQCTFWPP